MRLGFVGPGRMGSGMVRRFIAGGHEVMVYDLTEEVFEHDPDLGMADTYVEDSGGDRWLV